MAHQYRFSALTLLVFALLGQVIFFAFSSRYTQPRWQGRIFATLGIEYDGGDLHTLNDGAHYFGDTMIGWTKFPHFREALVAFSHLPADTQVNLHMQERQNLLLTLTSSQPLQETSLVEAKDFLQKKLDEYRLNTKTKMILTNVDYDRQEIRHSYAMGATFTLVLSLVLGAAFLFLKNEFFPPRLKL